MLAPANQQSQLEALDVLGLEVILPEDLKAFFYESGYLATTAEEFRGNARLRVRSAADILLMRLPIALQWGLDDHHQRFGKVLIKDLSRSGIGVIFHRQIFPEQRFQVRFQGRLIHAVAVRCRRLGLKCYETGGRIVSTEKLESGSDPSSSEAAS